MVFDPGDHFVVNIECFGTGEGFARILIPYLADADFEFAMSFLVFQGIRTVIPLRAVFFEMEMLVDVVIEEFEYGRHFLDDFPCFDRGMNLVHCIDDAAMLVVDGGVSGLV